MTSTTSDEDNKKAAYNKQRKKKGKVRRPRADGMGPLRGGPQRRGGLRADGVVEEETEEEEGGNRRQPRNEVEPHARPRPAVQSFISKFIVPKKRSK